MRRLCALILSTALVLATVSVVVLAISSDVAIADKKDADQDRKNAKKADQWRPLPYFNLRTALYIKCQQLGGVFTRGKTKNGTPSWGCEVGCGRSGCSYQVSCVQRRPQRILGETERGVLGHGNCRERGRTRGESPAVADTQSILDSGPALSANQPSRTGTPKPSPLPPPPPPPPVSD